MQNWCERIWKSNARSENRRVQEPNRSRLQGQNGWNWKYSDQKIQQSHGKINKKFSEIYLFPKHKLIKIIIFDAEEFFTTYLFFCIFFQKYSWKTCGKKSFIEKKKIIFMKYNNSWLTFCSFLYSILLSSRLQKWGKPSVQR